MPIKIIKQYAELKEEYDVQKLMMLKTSNNTLDTFEKMLLESHINTPDDVMFVYLLKVDENNKFTYQIDKE